MLSVLVLEDFCMAAYLPLLTVLASGGSLQEAVLWMAVAVSALGLAFLVSYRWGHHVGRAIGHPEDEQLLLRILGLTLIVAAVAEQIHASAAVGAFLVGLTLTGRTADRARAVLGPLRDLFAATFFLSIGFAVTPANCCHSFPLRSHWRQRRRRPRSSPGRTPLVATGRADRDNSGRAPR